MFIVLDGIDGAGKGRQRAELLAFLKDSSQSFLTTDFPDHNGDLYKKIIHPALHDELKLPEKAWFLTFLLDQLLWADKIQPFVGSTTQHFVCDGYFTTNLAYQVYARKVIGLDLALDLAEKFALPVPDIAIFLDVDPEIALKRKNQEEGHEEGLDLNESNLQMQYELRNAFRSMSEGDVYCKWSTVDGNKSIKEVREAIINYLTNQKFINI